MGWSDQMNHDWLNELLKWWSYCVVVLLKSIRVSIKMCKNRIEIGVLQFAERCHYNGSYYVLPLVSSECRHCVIPSVFSHMSFLPLSLHLSHMPFTHSPTGSWEVTHVRAHRNTHQLLCHTHIHIHVTYPAHSIVHQAEGREGMAGDGETRRWQALSSSLRANFHSASFPLTLWLSKRLLDIWISFLDPLEPSPPFCPQLGLLLKALQWSAGQTDDKILFIKTLTVCSQQIIKPIYLHSRQSIMLI